MADPTPPTDQTATTGATAGAQTGQSTATQSRLPESVRQKYPDLETLIHSTESMSTEEREYWFQIMPIMTDEQIEKLRGILVHEKEQLTKLDKEYEDELAKLNEKHLLEWKEQETKAAIDQRKKAEAAAEAEEKAHEEQLLQQLNATDDK